MRLREQYDVIDIEYSTSSLSSTEILSYIEKNNEKGLIRVKDYKSFEDTYTLQRGLRVESINNNEKLRQKLQNLPSKVVKYVANMF